MWQTLANSYGGVARSEGQGSGRWGWGRKKTKNDSAPWSVGLWGRTWGTRTSEGRFAGGE